MKVAPFVLIVAVILSGCGPRSGLKQEPPRPGEKAPPVKGKVVNVEIVVAPHNKLLAACKAANRPAYTIYVDEKSHQVFHCMGALTPHVDHGPGHVLSKADVPLSAGDQVRWFSTTHTFWVRPIVKGKEAPQNPTAPPTPFPPSFSFSKVPAMEVISPPVESVGGDEVVVQRYKVTFDITGLGVVDPDLICSM